MAALLPGPPSHRAWLWALCLATGHAQTLTRSSCTKDAADPAFARLCAWLDDSCEAIGLGAVFQDVFDRNGEAVRGLGVVSDVAKGEQIACIPQQCWINELVLEDASKELPAGLGACTETHLLAFWLAEEVRKGNDSLYAPYLSTLPGLEEYQQFHPAYLEGYALNSTIDYWGLWSEELRECHAAKAAPTFAEVKLAYVQLVSRQHESGMVPLFDMLNTGTEEKVNADQEDSEEGLLCLVAQRNLKAGEEIIVDYGLSSISPMLSFIVYGFALPSESHNLTVPNPEEDSSEFILSPEDDCAGLRPPEFAPPADAGPVLQRYVEFAQRYCAGSEAEKKEEETPGEPRSKQEL